jgi:hypothetical protein
VPKNDKFKDYTRYAEHCLNMVAAPMDQELRSLRRDMAAEWLRLADAIRRPRKSWPRAVVRVGISSCQSGRLSCRRHQRLRSEADRQPLLRPTSNVDAVADMAFGSPRPLSSTRQHRPVTITAL